MVEVLVIPDGAAQPPREDAPTALERAWLPSLDALASGGSLVRVATTPPGLPPGSETGIPALLGSPPSARPGRGRLDAAGYEIDVPAQLVPWRADLHYGNGRRATVRQARDVCRHLGPRALALGGHRLLLLSPNRPADRRILGLRLRVWDDGPLPQPTLGKSTTMVCARGTAAGCARVLGAQTITPVGTTGDVDTDLQAKLAATVSAIESGSERVVVHVGGPDEAAHRGEQEEVVRALEAIDAQLVEPLRALLEGQGGRLVVCPDHGTDPQTGVHDAAPVPAVIWPACRDLDSGPAFDERSARGAPLLAVAELFGEVALSARA